MFRTGKAIETESRLVVARGWGWGEMFFNSLSMSKGLLSGIKKGCEIDGYTT